jgi:hypothetical protein
MPQVAPLPMCPMAQMCKGMMERPLSGLVMIIPGLAFIALGLLIVAWPSVLPWLVATACIENDYSTNFQAFGVFTQPG